MPKYLVERELPGAGELSDEDLRTVSETSCGVLGELGPGIQWIESYVADDKVVCVVIADNKELIREHGRRAHLPVTRISAVRRMIDPTTAEAPQRLPVRDC